MPSRAVRPVGDECDRRQGAPSCVRRSSSVGSDVVWSVLNFVARLAWAIGCPEPVHAAGVDKDALAAGDQQRQKSAGAVVHAPPADRKDALPLLPAVAEQGAEEAVAAGEPRVAEHQVDVHTGVLVEKLVAEPQNLARKNWSSPWRVTNSTTDDYYNDSTLGASRSVFEPEQGL